MLKNILSPASIALIGASKTPGKLGYDILSNIVHLGYKGKIFPINPKGGEIFGLPVFHSVRETPQVPDMAIIAVPAKFVIDVADECGKNGIKGIVVISAGFKEVGEEGRKKEEELAMICKKYGMTLIGPNCLGILNTEISLNASFAEGMPPKGNVGLLSQSGAMAVAILDWAVQSGLGFSKVVSMGNKAGATENELLEYLADDPQTDVILMYLESVSAGEKFLHIAKEVSIRKPIIIVKSGRSEEGEKAISSHTGSLSGSDAAVEAGFAQAGIIRAMNTEELFDFARAFSAQKTLKNGRVAVVTNAGGPGILTTDAISESTLSLAEFAPETEERLKEGLPAAAATHNPVDVIGDAPASRYQHALKIVLADDNVDAVIVLLTPQVMTETKKVAKIVTTLAHKHPNKPVFATFMGGQNIKPAEQIFKRHALPFYSFPNNTVLALEKILWHEKWKQTHREDGSCFLQGVGPLKKPIELFEGVAQGVKLPVEKSFALFHHYGIPAPDVFLAQTAEEAVARVEEVGFPVVMKIASQDVYHKTDVGGIRIDIEDKESAEKAFHEILDSVKVKVPNAILRGVTVEKMMPMGKEIIIGATKDPQFGHVLMFGLGGIYVEILKDVSFRIAPVSHNEAKRMIEEIKALKILTGARGEDSVDLDAVAEVIVRVGQIVTDFPQIQEIEINPLIACAEYGVRAVDAKTVL